MRLQPFVPDHATARSLCRGAAALGALMMILLHPARASDAHAPAPTSAAASRPAVPRTAKAAASAGHAPARDTSHAADHATHWSYDGAGGANAWA